MAPSDQSVIGLERGIVRLTPYQPAWAEMFEIERERLEAAIGPFVLDIQHVGSTSIPGIPAKPIIDIGVAVRNFEEAAICIDPVVALGYTYRGENGIPRRHYFRKGNEEEVRTHHVHINEIDGPDWENQILFRDYLRAHPETAEQYAKIKRDLAQRYPKDRIAYLYGKAPFIEHILELARKERG